VLDAPPRYRLAQQRSEAREVLHGIFSRLGSVVVSKEKDDCLADTREGNTATLAQRSAQTNTATAAVTRSPLLLAGHSSRGTRGEQARSRRRGDDSGDDNAGDHLTPPAQCGPGSRRRSKGGASGCVLLGVK
jgi:hypothetical protein